MAVENLRRGACRRRSADFPCHPMAWVATATGRILSGARTLTTGRGQAGPSNQVRGRDDLFLGLGTSSPLPRPGRPPAHFALPTRAPAQAYSAVSTARRGGAPRYRGPGARDHSRDARSCIVQSTASGSDVRSSPDRSSACLSSLPAGIADSAVAICSRPSSRRSDDAEYRFRVDGAEQLDARLLPLGRAGRCPTSPVFADDVNEQLCSPRKPARAAIAQRECWCAKSITDQNTCRASPSSCIRWGRQPNWGGDLRGRRPVQATARSTACMSRDGPSRCERDRCDTGSVQRTFAGRSGSVAGASVRSGRFPRSGIPIA